MGPGLIAANAGNDAGGIATYASAGAAYGYDLLLPLVIVSIGLVVIQVMCTRLGIVTGKGLADLIREEFGVRWTALVMLALLIANAGITISEFLGIAASIQVLTNSTHTFLIYILLPLVGLFLWIIVTQGSYRRAESIFLVMSLAFLAYIPAVFLAHPDWHEVLHHAVFPTLHNDNGYMLALVALIGTTISPYMQFYLQSAIVDKGVHLREYVYSQIEVYGGTIFSVIIAACIVITTAATLYPHHTVQTAIDAAFSLKVVAGQYAGVLFAIGLFGASLLAAAVLPLSSAYAVCEAFGFEGGVSFSFREAPVFHSVFAGLIVLGVGIAIIPNIAIIQILLILQSINAAMLPIVLVFLTLLASNRTIMGEHANGKFFAGIAWTTIISVSIAVVLLLFTTLTGRTL
jgi:Mn2+/Fe2+ NRAMP family transporter